MKQASEGMTSSVRSLLYVRCSDPNTLMNKIGPQAHAHGQTDSCRRGREGTEGEKGKGAAKEHAGLTRAHGQRVVWTRGSGVGAGGREQQGGK